MLESIAISGYQDFCTKRLKTYQACPSFLQWLKDNSIKIANLPDNTQFWIKDAIRLAKS